MKHFVLFFFILFIGSCNQHENEDERIPIKVTRIELINVGEIDDYEFKFEAAPAENSAHLKNAYKCTLRTRFIQSNSIIDAIDAYAEGNKLNIHIESYPFDFENIHITRFPVHDLSFILSGFIKQGEYAVTLSINGASRSFMCNF
jgi:hypothetical protein